MPNVGLVVIGDVVEWMHSSIDNAWHPSIADPNLLQFLLEGPSKTLARDVESCIANAIVPGTLSPEVIQRRSMDWL